MKVLKILEALLKKARFISLICVPFMIAIIPQLIIAQPDTLWMKVYNTNDWSDGGNDAKETADGGFIIVGDGLMKTDASGEPIWRKDYYGREVIQTPDGGYVLVGGYLIKTDANGDTVFFKFYGGALRSVIQTRDGGFAVTGSYNMGPISENDSARTNYNLYLFKTDANGDTLWTKKYGDEKDDGGFSIVENEDEGFTAVGYTRSYGAGATDVYLIRTDANGDLLWQKTFGGITQDYGYDMAKTTDGGYVIAGYTNTFSRDRYQADVWLIKTDPNGDTLWTSVYGGYDWDKGWDVIQTSDGGYIVVGETWSFGAGETDIYLLGYDQHGKVLWTRTYGGTNFDNGGSISPTSDGDYIATGSTYFSGTYGYDIFLMKIEGSDIIPDLEPAQRWVPNQGTLDFKIRYDNWTNGLKTVGVLFEAYLPGGTEPTRTFSSTLDFDPGLTVKYYTLNVPAKAPIKRGYLWKAMIIDPPGSEEVAADREFTFEVRPPMESVPFRGVKRAEVSSRSLGGHPDTLWTKTYGGHRDDFGRSIVETSEGGYAFLGSTNSYGAGYYDVYLIKVNADGELLWDKTFGGPFDDRGYSVFENSDGGFIIAGSYSPGEDSIDAHFLRTNVNGDLIWSLTCGGGAEDRGFAAIQTADGGFLGGGKIGGASDYQYLVRIDSEGDILWTRAYGEGFDGQANAVVTTDDGGYIVAGETYSYWLLEGDASLVKIDSNGDTVWTRFYGGTCDDGASSVAITTDGGYILVGYTESFGAGEKDIYLIKTDSNGDTIWTRTYGGAENDKGHSVVQTSDGGCIIAGVTQSYGAGNADVYVIRTDAEGDAVWTGTWGGEGDDSGFSVSEVSEDGYIVGGWTKSFGSGGADFYLIRIDGESGMTLYLDPAQWWVPRKGTLDFRGRFSNWEEEPQTIEVLYEAYLPGATEPTRVFSDVLTFEPGATTKHYALSIPANAPKKGGYFLKGKLIDPPGSGIVIFEDSFDFKVRPAMESIP